LISGRARTPGVVGRVPPSDPLRHKGPYFRTLEWLAKRRPVTWFLINVGNRVDPVLMRATGGRVRVAPGSPTVVLTHVGARSGKRRSTPLAYFTDGDRVVLMASKGGAPRNPAWYHNVKANPDVELWVGRRGGRYRATEAEGDEYARLWNLATTLYDGYAKYQELAGPRRIPLIVCESLDG
jgi:deazaflavin-dependent oxidoreductase (nitroreductase family)